MYRHHQGATLLHSYITEQETEGPKEDEIPLLSASASKAEGVITLTMSNLSLKDDKEAEVDLLHYEAKEVLEAKIVHAEDVRAFNDFRTEEKVTEKEFTGYSQEGGSLKVKLPAHSVILLRIR
jgi:alpha-N-arabinofuranosidase